MQSHQRWGTGAVNGKRRASEIEGEGNSIGRNTHGRPSAVVVVYCSRTVVSEHFIVPVHETYGITITAEWATISVVGKLFSAL